jgi:hypothetical protein
MRAEEPTHRRAEEPTDRRLHVIRSEKPSALELDLARSTLLRAPEQMRPVPSWADLALVLAVCVPFWAGLTWLIATWL